MSQAKLKDAFSNPELIDQFSHLPMQEARRERWLVAGRCGKCGRLAAPYRLCKRHRGIKMREVKKKWEI